MWVTRMSKKKKNIIWHDFLRFFMWVKRMSKDTYCLIGLIKRS